MSFDALTIVGIVSSVLCGGFLVALVSRTDGDREPTEPPCDTDGPVGDTARPLPGP